MKPKPSLNWEETYTTYVYIVRKFFVHGLYCMELDVAKVSRPSDSYFCYQTSFFF